MVNSVNLRPDRIRQFDQTISELAGQARGEKDAWRWTAHQTLFGNVQAVHFAYETEDFAALETLGRVDELWSRVLGETRGEELFQKTNECIESSQHTVSIDRPDLSYPPENPQPADFPLASLTILTVRSGQMEACEELIRKVAEAIPKTDDSARIVTFQTMYGDLRQYWTVRPVHNLAELDGQKPTPELLNRAFGTSEGGLIWRTGTEAIQEARREITAYREDLSNPPA
jgi:hypothetical protein